MQYRKLGNSGTLVSALALGTMNFGTPETPQDEAFAQLDAFIEVGGNLIDTADVYNGGVAEETVGRWLAARPREATDRAIIATKGRIRTGEDVNDAGTSRRHLDRAVATSLRRLGTETIDLYQLHAWDPLTPIEEALSFLDSAIRAGKIRYAGLSNFTGWQLQLTVSTARAGGYQVPVTLQAQYNLATRQTEWEMMPAARHNGLGILAWSPPASGFLTGKYQRNEKRSPGTRAGQDHRLYQYTSSNYETSDRTWNAVDAVRQVAKETGLSPARVALSWLPAGPALCPSSSVPGTPGSSPAVSPPPACTSRQAPWRSSTPPATRTRLPTPTALSAQPSATGRRTVPRPSASLCRPTSVPRPARADGGIPAASPPDD
jgi:aryl-alcohol dehydrogenase-like predicted oxidoreductase